MRPLLALLAVLCCVGSAQAQQAIRIPSCGTASPPAGVSQLYMDANGNLCVGTSNAPVAGFGTLSVTSGSALLSTLTAGPNSAAWPTSPRQVYVVNAPASSGTLYVCPKGGTCSASTGIPIAAGGAYGFYQPATTMTVVSASTSTAVAQW